MSALTEFRVGDSAAILVAKILRTLGGSPRPTDTEAMLWRKVLIALGGVSRPADSQYDTLLKIERILDPSDFCTCGDSEHNLLRKILEFLAPGSFRFGDSGYDLRRKILLNIVVQPAPPTPPVDDENCLLLEGGLLELYLESRDDCVLLES